MTLWLHTELTRQLLLIKDIRSFRNFIGLLAGRVGAPLNLSSLGGDVGISDNTVKEWLSILEASYIIRLIYPYTRNFSKRLIKSPMPYFLDTGLLCALLGVRCGQDYLVHPLKGSIFENFIFTELAKIISHHKNHSQIYFWRDHRGEEVDFMVEQSPNKVHLLECRAGKTVSESFFKSLTSLGERLGEHLGGSYLVYGGDMMQKRSKHKALPWCGLGDEMETVLGL